MNEILRIFENPVYELRSSVHLTIRNSRTVFFLGAKWWNMAPVIINSSESLNVFKSKIKY